MLFNYEGEKQELHSEQPSRCQLNTVKGVNIQTALRQALEGGFWESVREGFYEEGSGKRERGRLEIEESPGVREGPLGEEGVSLEGMETSSGEGGPEC